jgi:RNA polymerase sigma factor (sigma-70 family)
MQLVWQKAFMQSSAGTVEKINVAWLKKVAYREAIDLIRKDATRNKHIRADENIQQMESPESAVLEVSEHGENLKNCLDGLSEAERVVISKWSEGVKPVVIAEQAGKPAETIYKMVHHIKARLKVCMETKSGITHGERPAGGRS